MCVGGPGSGLVTTGATAPPHTPTGNGLTAKPFAPPLRIVLAVVRYVYAGVCVCVCASSRGRGTSRVVGGAVHRQPLQQTTHRAAGLGLDISHRWRTRPPAFGRTYQRETWSNGQRLDVGHCTLLVRPDDWAE